MEWLFFRFRSAVVSNFSINLFITQLKTDSDQDQRRWLLAVL